MRTGGSSQTIPRAKEAKQFHGVQEDLQSVGEFIRLYTTRFERWGSPKYLAGESYGTTRAAALAAHLQDSVGMRLNGVVLVSVVLNFQTIVFNEGNDLPDWLKAMAPENPAAAMSRSIIRFIRGVPPRGGR